MTFFPPGNANQTFGPSGELFVTEKSLRMYHSPHNGPTGTSNIRDIESVVGSGTVSVTSGESEWKLSTAAVASDEATLESSVNARPIPGTLAEAGFSIRIPTGPTGNQLMEWGIDDGTTGVGFGMNATSLFVYVRSNGTSTKVQKASWNVDALDGSGPSGLTLTTPTTATRFLAEFSSTFLGLINFYVVLWDSSTYEMKKVLVHRWAPVSGAVNSAPFAPLYTHVENGATATATDLYCQERWFATAGKVPDTVFREVFQFRLNQSTSTTVIPTISVRRKSGARNARARIYITSFDQIAATAALVTKVALDHGLTGASFATGQTTAGETSTEMDISATAISGGSNKFECLVPTGGYSFNFLGVDKIYLPNDQTPLTITSRTVSGTGTVHTVMRLAEEW